MTLTAENIVIATGLRPKYPKDVSYIPLVMSTKALLSVL